MKQFFLIFNLLIAFNVSAEQQLTFGHSEKLFSKVLNEERTLLIKLPEGYENTKDTRYPVVYTLDGTTHFHHVAGTMQWLSDVAGISPQHIVVALVTENGLQRARDFTMRDKGITKENGIELGGGDNFIKFLSGELIPYIDRKFQTNNFKTLSAHSAGGSLALHVMSTKINLFQAYIVMSPNINSSKPALRGLERFELMLKSNVTNPKFLFVSQGNEPVYKEGFGKLTKLLEKYSHERLNWKSQINSHDTHMSNPSSSFHDAMVAISYDKGWSIPTQVTHRGLTAVKHHYQNLSEKLGYTISPAEGLLINMAYDNLKMKQFEKAITTFKLATTLYPRSSNAHDSLADAYEVSGSLEQAKAVQKIAVELARTQNSSNLEQVKKHLSIIEEKLNKK